MEVLKQNSVKQTWKKAGGVPVLTITGIGNPLRDFVGSTVEWHVVG